MTYFPISLRAERRQIIALFVLRRRPSGVAAFRARTSASRKWSTNEP